MSEGLVLTGRYRLIRQLGAGGMGSVWLAEDLNLSAEVAVKLIDPMFAESPETVERFRREAQSAAMIRSTHVVQILDHGVDQGRPFIAMEMLRGEDLAQRLEREHAIGAVETAQILGQVGRALSIAHSSGIIHRDLKPENIFLAREGDRTVAKILDFGIARRASGLTDSSVSKTRTGSLLGTPYYMSPEQATAQPVDFTTDIWSFGVIAFECLTGRRAFEGESVGSLFHAICMSPMPVPSKVAQVPAGFDDWFARAVTRDRSQRFGSMKEAAESLWLLCGRSSGSLVDVSVDQLMHTGNEVLSTTAVGVMASGVDVTQRAPARTLGGRIRKHPVRASLLGLVVLGVAIGGVVTWRQLDARSAQGAAPPTPLVAVQPSATVPAASEPAASASASAVGTPVVSPEFVPASVSASAKVSLLAPAQKSPSPRGATKTLLPQAAKSAVLPAPETKKTATTGPSKPSGTPSSRDDNAAGI